MKLYALYEIITPLCLYMHSLKLGGSAYSNTRMS